MRRATRNISNGTGCLLTAAGLCLTLGLPRAAAAQQAVGGKSGDVLRDAVHRLGSTAASTELGAIDGSVRDASGAAVAGVELTITQLATADVQRRVSDVDGAFKIANLSPGVYEIKAASPGFRDADGKIVVTSSGRVRADVRMDPGTGARAIRRPHRHRVLPGQERCVR